ncbi:MAG: ATPase [Betaproteobacteria bacterium]|nr:ATPase [Betaproteobacteria bacterium]
MMLVNTSAIKNGWGLLSPQQRNGAAVLLALTVVGTILETLGIGFVVPAMALMTQGDLAARYPPLEPVLAAVGNPSRERMVVAGMLILVTLYIVKTFYLGYLAWRQARFVYDVQASISRRLFSGYLRQPYTFHLQRNSAQLIRNAIGQAGGLSSIIQETMLLISETLVLISLSLLLVTVEPLGALLVVSILGIAGFSFSRLTRKHVLRWGEVHQLHEGMRIQHIQQGLGSAKDLKLLGREEEFIAQYAVHNEGTARVGERQAALQAIPRLGLELLAAVGLATLVLVMVAQHKPLDALLPTLGLFAAAAFRIMPSVSRILGASHGIRYSLPVIATLNDEFQLFKIPEASPQSSLLACKGRLSIKRVGYRYPSATTDALEDINMSIDFGKAVGIIGTSGAGKSTLIDVMLGLIPPQVGTVEVDGVDIRSNIRGWQDQIGYVPQTIYLTDDSIRRNVAFGLPDAQIDEGAVWKALKNAQLETFVRSLPGALDTPVGERGIRLSGGQRQRIGIARALYHDPAVLVLDEATSSLDTATESDVMESVRELRGGKTIIIVAHRLTTIERCDLVFRLENGRLVSDAHGEPASVSATR